MYSIHVVLDQNWFWVELMHPSSVGISFMFMSTVERIVIFGNSLWKCMLIIFSVHNWGKPWMSLTLSSQWYKHCVHKDLCEKHINDTSIVCSQECMHKNQITCKYKCFHMHRYNLCCTMYKCSVQMCIVCQHALGVPHDSASICLAVLWGKPKACDIYVCTYVCMYVCMHVMYH